MSRKLLLTLAAAILLVVLIAGISAATRKQESTAEESSEAVSEEQIIIVPSAMPERISFEVPAGFTETASASYDKYYVMNDASVIVTGEDLKIYGQNVKTYGESVKEQYAQTADDFELISEETTAVSGVDCCLYEFTYAIKNTDASQGMQCITAVMIKDERVYIMTCKSHRENFPVYRQSFRKMIETIKIADDTPSVSSSQTDALTESTSAAAVS